MAKSDEVYSTNPKTLANTNELKEIVQGSFDFWDCIIEKIKSTTFEGNVELIMFPPIDQGFSLRLHRVVKSIPQMESVDIRISEDKGIVFSLHFNEPTELLRKLAEMQDIRIRFQSKNRILIRQAEGKQN